MDDDDDRNRGWLRAVKRNFDKNRPRMSASSVKHFENFERALSLAQNGPYGQQAVRALMRMPMNFEEGTEKYYRFCFVSCGWYTRLSLIPRFTRLFEFMADIGCQSIVYLTKNLHKKAASNEKEIYAVTKHDGITSAEKPLHVARKHEIWRTCLFLDVFVEPHLDELRDPLSIIRDKLCEGFIVPAFHQPTRDNSCSLYDLRQYIPF